MSNILKVIYKDIEYRCEETKEQCPDPMLPFEYITETIRSKWFSKDGKELDEKIALDILNQNNIETEKQKLIAKLFEKD